MFSNSPTTSYTTIIEGKNIHRVFKAGEVVTHVLKGINIAIREGEFLGIMGKSGAGKSTLLYQLSGLDRPSEGEIIIGGSPITQLTEKELGRFRLQTLGFVFQDYALIPDLTARENVMLPILMRGTDWMTAQNTADATLDAVGLTGKYTNLPAQLSGGEQQRVSIARAIGGKPKILFADEPTANLDSISGRAVIDLLTKLHKDGQTIVMVTHEEEYATECNRIIFMEDGLVVGEKEKMTSPYQGQNVPKQFI